MAQVTTNTQPFIEAEVYSQLILENLHDGMLPAEFTRNVTDFPNGTTLHIKTIGTVTIQEAEEDTPLSYSPIDTGQVTLTISNYIGDGYVKLAA